MVTANEELAELVVDPLQDDVHDVACVQSGKCRRRRSKPGHRGSLASTDDGGREVLISGAVPKRRAGKRRTFAAPSVDSVAANTDTRVDHGTVRTAA